MRRKRYTQKHQFMSCNQRNTIRMARKNLKKGSASRERYALIQNGNVDHATVGEPWLLARRHLKQNHILLGLKKVGSQLFYYLKFRERGIWARCRAISDTGDFEANRRLAFEDYFYHGMKLHQDGFKLIKLD